MNKEESNQFIKHIDDRTVPKKRDLPSLNYISPGRFICTVFEEMRECIKKLNFAPMPSLIEEAQIMANRMEESLENKGGIDSLREDIRKLKKIRKELYADVQKLNDQLPEEN